MDIYPAIDLRGGQCVRLTKGDFATAKVYETDPLKQARVFMDDGSTWLHMVDLDGAQKGTPQQLDVIAQIVNNTSLKVQAGGGIRDEAVIQRMLDHGLSRAVIGSLAVKDPELVKSWMRRFGTDKLLLAFDVNISTTGEPEVATHGWQSGSGISLWAILKNYADCPLDTIMCTDIDRDGVLQGVNIGLYQDMKMRFPKLKIIASGGVSSMDDLKRLKDIGVEGVIVGKALYEGRINLKDALMQVSHVG